MSSAEWDAVDDFVREVEPGRAARDSTGHEYDERARAQVLNCGIGCSAPEHVAFLRVVGTPDALAAEHELAAKALHALDSIVRDRRNRGYARPRFFSEEYGEAVDIDTPDGSGFELLDRLYELCHYLDAALLEARRAVDLLEDQGFEYREGRLYVSGTGGRARQVLREVVGRTWEWVRDPDDPMYSREVLDRVRAALSGVFPAELLPDDASLKRAIQYSRERERR